MASFKALKDTLGSLWDKITGGGEIVIRSEASSGNSPGGQNMMVPGDNPPRDNPVRDNPVRDNPPRDNPVRDNPVRDNPVRDNPVRDNPVRDNPVRDNPGYKTLPAPVPLTFGQMQAQRAGDTNNRQVNQKIDVTNNIQSTDPKAAAAEVGGAQAAVFRDAARMHDTGDSH